MTDPGPRPAPQKTIEEIVRGLLNDGPQATIAIVGHPDCDEPLPGPSATTNKQDFRDGKGMTECNGCGSRYPDGEVPIICKYCGTEDDWSFV